MQNNKFKYILLTFLLGTVSAFATKPHSNFTLLKESESFIKLVYKSNYNGDSLITLNGIEQKLPLFDGVYNLFDKEGTPQFISKSIFIVPSPNAFRIREIGSQFENFENYKLYKNPASQYSDAADYDFGGKPFILRYAGVSGGQHIAELIISNIYYNSDNESIRILKEINLQIDFDVKKASYSQNPVHFNSLLALNFESAKFWVKQSTGEKLLSPDAKSMTALSNGQWGRIVIEEEGVYRLDPSDLQSIGIPVNSSAARTLKIFGKGGKALSERVSDGAQNNMDEQEIIVRTKADGTIDHVIFYAAYTNGFELVGNNLRHYKNYYSDRNYYLITWGGDEGKRASAPESPDDEVVNRPGTYTARLFFDEDIVNPYNPGAGRDWFGRSFFNSPFPPIMLHDLDRSGEVSYRFALAHKSESTSSFTIFENNNQIQTLNLFPRNDNYVAAVRGFANATVPASQISGDNRSIIRLQYQSPQISGVGYFDYYEIAYPRRFFAISNSIGFIADNKITGNTEFSINGFSGEVFGFDISDLKNPKLLANKSSTGSIFTFNHIISANKVNRFFISGNLKKAKLETLEIVNLRDKMDNAPIVVVTHPDLYESALKYKVYREQTHNLKVEVYRTDHIYNEFAGSIPDITAIRDFLINAYMRWDTKPEYLVIWGDGHYDYKNIATKKTNYVPAYQTFTYDLSSFNEIYDGYATDDYLALLDGDDLLVDINFGRVTIDNPDLGFWMVDKIKHYETSSADDIWRTNIIFIADDGPAENEKYDGNLFTHQTENLQANFISKHNPDFQYDKIYLVEFPTVFMGSGRRKPAVTEDMLTRVNTTGALLMNWIGHGNPRVWAHEQILDRDITIPRMRNLDKLFFLTAATCDYGRFDNPEVRSGAEDMFLSKSGGAIGVFSATRVVFASENARLANLFYTRLLTRDSHTGKFPTLGQVVNTIKQNSTSTNDRKYFLIGDPTMRLLIPDYRLSISEINGVAVDGNEIELKALSKITIKGEVRNPQNQSLENSYNGTVVVTLRDGDQNMSLRELFNNSPRDIYNFNKLGGMLNRSSYKVTNGVFEAEFIIPKDISFSDSNSRIFLYSASDDGRYGSGSYQNLKITGFADSQIKDTISPEIQVFLDGRNFKTGDIVTTNPRLIVDLFDESGINTTGLGIGHKIEAWIDNSPLSIDLTDKFSSSLTDSRRGTVEDILFGLSPGEHSIRVRAWDVFNNFAIGEAKFIIPADGDGRLITNLINYPNPFSSFTNIVFRHNAIPPFDVNIDIYTINGVLIRNIKTNISTLHTSQVYWDGFDNSGFLIPAGIYLYNVRIQHDNGESIGRGKLIKLSN